MTERSTPPVARVIPTTVKQHRHTLVDNYAWLHDKTDPQVRAYLEAENRYAQTSLAHTQALQETLFHEMRGRIQEDDVSYPERDGDYEYYTRTQAGQQYKVYCRRRISSLGGVEDVILDENALAEGLTFCRVGVLQTSPDQTLLAYGVDTTGAIVFDLYVKDLGTGEVVAGPIPNTGWTVAWASDNRSLFYTVFDAAHRPYQVWRHRVGDDPSDDTLVYEEKDEAYSLGVARSSSGQYIFITAKSWTASEVRAVRADQPDGDFEIIEKRKDKHEYYVTHHDDYFLIRTNEDAENFRIMRAPLRRPGKRHWDEIVPHRADTLVEGMHAFRDYLVLYERRDGLKQVRISSPDGQRDAYRVSLPDPAYTLSPGGNRQYDTATLRLFYSSLVTPLSTVDFDMERREWQVRKVDEIPSGYDPDQYVSERLFATAPDGQRVPLSVVYRRGLRRDGRNPAVLLGYGAYGYSMEPGFDPKRLSLLDRGVIFALAHIRGGSEMGRAWYEDGRLMHKKNTFTDFIACAETLIAEGYTRPERLAIWGGSAGGLLVSAVANMRPDLFKAVVAMVPFTNVITAMLMPELPLTVTEYDQWGNPADRKAFDYMLSYSPYENVAAQDYPAIYARAGLNDLQVPYWDPAKWVARLRATKTDANPLYLITNMGAGHGGASGRYTKLREDAEVYAFVIDTLGASE